MNSTFIMLALLVTFGYVVYYAVTISRDIVKSRKTNGTDMESFNTGEGGGESSPKYIGEDGETERSPVEEGRVSDVDNEPHTDESEQVGNDRVDVGAGRQVLSEEPIDFSPSSDKPCDYRAVLGYAKEIAVTSPVQIEYENMFKSDDYLEDMLEGINNESQIKYTVTQI